MMVLCFKREGFLNLGKQCASLTAAQLQWWNGLGSVNFSQTLVISPEDQAC